MATKTRSRKARTSAQEMDELAQRDAGAASPGRAHLTQASKELVDEIDALLEKNAEDFIARFVQKGGE